MAAPARMEPVPPAIDAPARRDASVGSLVVANALALVCALVAGWSTQSLMMVYWAQSVVIGVSSVARILSLQRFSTENFRINRRSVEPTPATRTMVACFFALHFGLFHAVYLGFLLQDGTAAAAIDPLFWLCIAAFAVNHAWSFRYNIARDRQGTPNIGTLMFTPYLRIVPMHLTLIVGGLLIDSAASLVLFGALKAVADVAMHLVEHRRLRALGPAPESCSP